MGGVSVRNPPELAGIWWLEVISEGKSFTASVALRAAVPRYFGSGLFGTERFRPSGVVENQSPAVAEGDFFGLPGGALVEVFRGRA